MQLLFDSALCADWWKTQQEARRLRRDIVFEWVPSHGKQPFWSPRYADLHPLAARAVNQAADEAAGECNAEQMHHSGFLDWKREEDEAAEWSRKALELALQVQVMYNDFLKTASSSHPQLDGAPD